MAARPVNPRNTAWRLLLLELWAPYYVQEQAAYDKWFSEQTTQAAAAAASAAGAG